MNWERIWAIARKDWREVRFNMQAMLPMLIVPVIFVVVMPLLVLLGSNTPLGSSALNDPDMSTFLSRMPANLTAFAEGLDFNQSMILYMLGFFFAPFFLMMPIMFSTVIAAESFAGELERKTIESLLYTPVRDSELFLGKALAAFLPGVLITWISFIVYTLVLNIAGMPVMERIWFPLPSWYPLVFWVTPALAAMGTAFTVLISARTKTFMGAYQSSSALVILVLGLFGGQMAGVLYLSVGVGLIIGAVVWIAAAVMAWIGIRKFNRKTILVAG